MNPPPGAKLTIRADDPSHSWRGSSIHLVVGERDEVLDADFLEVHGLELRVCWDSGSEAWPGLWEGAASGGELRASSLEPRSIPSVFAADVQGVLDDLQSVLDDLKKNGTFRGNRE